MDSFNEILEEVNESEEQYHLKLKEYSELQSIILQDKQRTVSSISAENVGTSCVKSPPAATRESAASLNKKSMHRDAEHDTKNKSVNASGDHRDVKKMVKARIKTYHGIVANTEKSRFDDREKAKFVAALGKNNMDVLKALYVESVQQLIEGMRDD